MLGHAGYFTGLPNEALKGMIDIVKGVEPEVGYSSIMQLSEVEAFMRESQIKRTKTVCTYCGVGCSFDIWTQGASDPQSRAARRSRQRGFDLHQGQVRVGLCQQSRSPDQAADS